MKKSLSPRAIIALVAFALAALYAICALVSWGVDWGIYLSNVIKRGQIYGSGYGGYELDSAEGMSVLVLTFLKNFITESFFAVLTAGAFALFALYFSQEKRGEAKPWAFPVASVILALLQIKNVYYAYFYYDTYTSTVQQNVTIFVNLVLALLAIATCVIFVLWSIGTVKRATLPLVLSTSLVLGAICNVITGVINLTKIASLVSGVTTNQEMASSVCAIIVYITYFVYTLASLAFFVMLLLYFVRKTRTELAEDRRNGKIKLRRQGRQ